ncbi:MAG: 30S ribosome-binding factor RbfA, partial [Advenella sp.]
SLLFKMLHIHTVPTLRFFHDDQLARGIEMTQLIDRANRPEDYPESVDPLPDTKDDRK